jgi:hypothetical protein
MILELGEGELSGPHIPVEIDSLEQLSDVCDWWGVNPRRAGPLDVERSLDRYQVWVSGRVAVRRLGGARRDR